MRCYQCSCLRTQSGLTQAHGLESGFYSLGYFFFGEIPLRSDENQGILTRYNCFFQQFFLTFITMANELLTFELLRNELVEIRHFVQYRLV